MALVLINQHSIAKKPGGCEVQAAAGMGIYGPRTVYCIALKDCPGCHEFLLQDDGKWLHVKETTEIGAHTLKTV